MNESCGLLTHHRIRLIILHISFLLQNKDLILKYTKPKRYGKWLCFCKADGGKLPLALGAISVHLNEQPTKKRLALIGRIRALLMDVLDAYAHVPQVWLYPHILKTEPAWGTKDWRARGRSLLELCRQRVFFILVMKASKQEQWNLSKTCKKWPMVLWWTFSG